MKSQNRRDLEKHWAEQSKKRTPAEQLQFKAEKLRRKIEQAKAAPDQNGQEPVATEGNKTEAKASAGKSRKKAR